MLRIIPPSLLCVALWLTGMCGCSSTPSTPPGGEETLLLEVEEIDIIPGGPEKQVKVKTGKAASAEAPKESGVTANVDDGKLTVKAGNDAKEGTHEVKVKDARGKTVTLKVKVKKPGDE